ARGSDYAAGERLLEAGLRLQGPHLALAASAGRSELRVFRRPRVFLIATGDELTPPGAELPPGRIFDSNTAALRAEVSAAGAELIGEAWAGDDAGQIAERFMQAHEEGADLILSTGGVSVGSRDRVPEAWRRLSLKPAVGRISMKPGGPFLAGCWGDTA